MRSLIPLPQNRAHTSFVRIVFFFLDGIASGTPVVLHIHHFVLALFFQDSPRMFPRGPPWQGPTSTSAGTGVHCHPATDPPISNYQLVNTNQHQSAPITLTHDACDSTAPGEVSVVQVQAVSSCGRRCLGDSWAGAIDSWGSLSVSCSLSPNHRPTAATANRQPHPWSAAHSPSHRHRPSQHTQHTRQIRHRPPSITPAILRSRSIDRSPEPPPRRSRAAERLIPRPRRPWRSCRSSSLPAAVCC